MAEDNYFCMRGGGWGAPSPPDIFFFETHSHKCYDPSLEMTVKSCYLHLINVVSPPLIMATPWVIDIECPSGTHDYYHSITCITCLSSCRISRTSRRCRRGSVVCRISRTSRRCRRGFRIYRISITFRRCRMSMTIEDK